MLVCRSGEKSELHPLDTQFSALMRSWRAKGAPEDNARRTCMCFTDKQGSQYYYDFAAAARLTTPPAAHTLIAPMATLDVPTYRYVDAHNICPARWVAWCFCACVLTEAMVQVWTRCY